jgi:hypothetical protein
MESVVTGSTAQMVFPPTAGEPIVSGLSIEPVVAAAAGDAIVPDAAVDPVGIGRSREAVVHFHVLKLPEEGGIRAADASREFLLEAHGVKHRGDDGIAVQVVSGSLPIDVEAVVQVRPVDVPGMLDHHLPDVVGVTAVEIKRRAVPLRWRVPAPPVRRGGQVHIGEGAERAVAQIAAPDHLLRQDAALRVGHRLDQVEVLEFGVEALVFHILGFDGDCRRHGALLVQVLGIPAYRRLVR